MISFNLEKPKALELIQYFKNYYDLTVNSCEELDKNFSEYAKLYENNVSSNESLNEIELQSEIKNTESDNKLNTESSIQFNLNLSETKKEDLIEK